jgi:glycerophosphoryl diester phosphodiesterase
LISTIYILIFEIRIVKIIVHRAGYANSHQENTFCGAKKSFSVDRIDGIELDLSYTLDGIPVITHKSVSNINYDEFVKKYSDQNSLDEWVSWLNSSKEYSKKTVLIHIKSESNVLDLLEILSNIPNPLILGSVKIKLVKELC